jgi:hypothetical protein
MADGPDKLEVLNFLVLTLFRRNTWTNSRASSAIRASNEMLVR